MAEAHQKDRDELFAKNGERRESHAICISLWNVGAEICDRLDKLIEQGEKRAPTGNTVIDGRDDWEKNPK